MKSNRRTSPVTIRLRAFRAGRFQVPIKRPKLVKAKRTKNVGLDISEWKKLVPYVPTVEYGIGMLYEEAFNGNAEMIRGRSTYP